MHTYLHTTVCVCMDTYMYTCWNIIKQLLNSKGDAGLPIYYFLIDSTEIKDANFMAETFNSYFINLGPTLAEKNPQSPKSYDDSPSTLFIRSITNLLLGNNTDIFITKKFYFSWN